MWSSQIELLERGRMVKHSLYHSGVRATFAEVISHWQQESAFQSWFNQLLADSEFQAFRWETPPLTVNNVNRPFEFVVYDSPGLLTRPDGDAFAEHFQSQPNKAVIQFTNLSGDATLIVPALLGSHFAYGHLATFVREAPPEQQQQLWETVGHALQARLSVNPVWLSTAGAGVAWLHVRLDSRPKYYGHAPYRTAP